MGPRSEHGSGPPEVNMEVDLPEVNMEVDPLEVNMEVDPLDGPAGVQATHRPYINWKAGGFPLKKGFLLVPVMILAGLNKLDI